MNKMMCAGSLPASICMMVFLISCIGLVLIRLMPVRNGLKVRFSRILWKFREWAVITICIVSVLAITGRHAPFLEKYFKRDVLPRTEEASEKIEDVFGEDWKDTASNTALYVMKQKNKDMVRTAIDTTLASIKWDFGKIREHIESQFDKISPWLQRDQSITYPFVLILGSMGIGFFLVFLFGKQHSRNYLLWSVTYMTGMCLYAQSRPIPSVLASLAVIHFSRKRIHLENVGRLRAMM